MTALKISSLKRLIVDKPQIRVMEVGKPTHLQHLDSTRDIKRIRGVRSDFVPISWIMQMKLKKCLEKHDYQNSHEERERIKSPSYMYGRI